MIQFNTGSDGIQLRRDEELFKIWLNGGPTVGIGSFLSCERNGNHHKESENGIKPKKLQTFPKKTLDKCFGTWYSMQGALLRGCYAMTREIAVSRPVTSAEYVRTGFGRLISCAVPMASISPRMAASRQILSAFCVPWSDTRGGVYRNSANPHPSSHVRLMYEIRRNTNHGKRIYPHPPEGL